MPFKFFSASTLLSSFSDMRFLLLLQRTSIIQTTRPTLLFRVSDIANVLKKCTQIHNSILLQMLGKSRVTKFVLQGILTITIEKFIKKENLKVNPEIRMTQAESEMESAFMPGSAFLFNVILQLEKFDSDEDSEEQSDSSE